MAEAVTIGGEGTLFIGEDKTFNLFVYDRKVVNVAKYSNANLPLGYDGLPVIPKDENQVAAVPISMAGWTVQFVVRQNVGSSAALIDKTATIVGVYNANPSVNTERAEVVCTDTELGITVFTRATEAQQSWKRTDDGSETVLAYRKFVIERATQV